jgi:hypothetical protein
MTSFPLDEVVALAASGESGALVRIELPKDATVEVLDAVAMAVEKRLPPGVALYRTLWSRFTYVMRGERESLVEQAKQLVDVATGNKEGLVVQIIMISVVREYERTLRCDPNYDLAASDASIFWAEPYAGDDWLESQRYPTVTVYSPH